jgi:hypothetical protein
MTPREFAAAVHGWKDREYWRERNEWERTRWQAAAILSAHVPKGKSFGPKNLMEFEWEKVEKPKISPEQLDKIWAAMDRHAIQEAAEKIDESQ